jgi:DNA-binding transcriptional MerR regulator
MDSAALTLREIAREMNLPESTIRYYRDAFALYIPTVGLGRRRRYAAESLELFQVIVEGYAQNLSREDIEARLQERSPAASAPASVPATRPAPLRLHRQTPVSRQPTEELVATIMDGERERRDVMWQLAREIVRMGEALERQQLALMQITQHLDWTNRLPPVAGLPVPYMGTGVAPAVPTENTLAKELSSLREELQRERELVERLRRSKLEIEQRATAAENELERRADSPDLSALRRFLGKDPA